MTQETLTLLLAEDNDGDYELLKAYLDELEGPCAIERVFDGEEVLPFLRKQGNTPDVIILDINMPLMNGHDVLKQLASDSELRSIPRVVLTSSNASSDVEKAQANGANGYMVKPGNFTYEDLCELINKTLEDPSTFIPVGKNVGY